MNKHHLNSNLAKAKGLGSTHEGTDHFIHQRLTAVALIPLVLWFCFAIAMLPNMDYESLIHWVKNPINSVLLMVTISVSFYHLQLGLQVIIEDYIAGYFLKLTSLIAMKFFCIFFSITGVFAVLKISLGS